jgi:LacI family transcriptional regulator, repressor for deo operon, udp, cdd, tsx, nupC, and nupG
LKNQKITINDIARMCRTSKATVSRVMNNPEIVAAPLRNRVLRTVKECNYTSHPFAKNLGSRTKWGFAIFVQDILNQFYAVLVREVSRIAMEANIPLIICDTAKSVRNEEMYLESVLKNHIAGVIFTEGVSKHIVDRAIREVPVVLLDHHYDIDIPHYEISSNNLQGGFEAVDYLYKLGHRKIGIITGVKGWTSSEKRYQGYCEALEHNNVKIRKEYCFEGSFDIESGAEALKYFVTETDITAIFSANDRMAYGVLQQASVMNISIPQDISLVGFDNLPLCNIIKPSLTTIQQDYVGISSKSIECLLNQCKGVFSGWEESIVLPIKLIKRESAIYKSDSYK